MVRDARARDPRAGPVAAGGDGEPARPSRRARRWWSSPDGAGRRRCCCRGSPCRRWSGCWAWPRTPTRAAAEEVVARRARQAALEAWPRRSRGGPARRGVDGAARADGRLVRLLRGERPTADDRDRLEAFRRGRDVVQRIQNEALAAARAEVLRRAPRAGHRPGGRGPRADAGWTCGPVLLRLSEPRRSERVARSRAVRRSSTRSSTSSMPTDSRTSESGTSSAEPATDMCVIWPGCSISDSTPPSDSARVNSSVAAHTRSAASRPPASGERHHPAEAAHLLGRHLVPGVLGQARVEHARRPPGGRRASRRRARRCRSAAPCAPRASSTPRRVSQLSNGPGTEPTAFWVNVSCSASSSSLVTSAPPTTSECPPRYLVVECSDDVRAERERLLQVGRGEGVVDDEPGPGLARATSATAAMSAMPSSGFVGVSHQTTRVVGRSAARRASRSARSTGVYSTPHGASTLSTSRNVPP